MRFRDYWKGKKIPPKGTLSSAWLFYFSLHIGFDPTSFSTGEQEGGVFFGHQKGYWELWDQRGQRPHRTEPAVRRGNEQNWVEKAAGFNPSGLQYTMFCVFSLHNSPVKGIIMGRSRRDKTAWKNLSDLNFPIPILFFLWEANLLNTFLFPDTISPLFKLIHISKCSFGTVEYKCHVLSNGNKDFEKLTKACHAPPPGFSGSHCLAKCWSPQLWCHRGPTMGPGLLHHHCHHHCACHGSGSPPQRDRQEECSLYISGFHANQGSPSGLLKKLFCVHVAPFCGFRYPQIGGGEHTLH